ncbi:MAG: MlaE family lipid ABC transporter permease subunit [Gammaproteobacteria bacterium]|nr:MlaE family lipid ABC transporter permease subunit [Gammaproteobacteria bacterium]
MSFRTKKSLPNQLEIIFSGKLDVDQVASIWHDCVSKLTQERPNSLILNFKEVDYCDGAGIALIQALQKQQSVDNNSCFIINLAPNFQQLLEYIEAQPDKVEPEELPIESFREQLGHMAVDVVKTFRDNVIFIGMLSYQLFFTLFNPKKIRWQDFLRVAEDTGPQAVPIIALIGFLIGLISTFQAAPSFANFGVQIYMVDLVGLGLVREMGPLLTAVLLAGRTASSFAAEIGTMKINQEVDALKTMGLNPIRFLVVPRVLATMMITPILEVFFIIFGLLGCLVVMLSLGYTSDAFFNRIHQAILPMDYIGGLIKVFVFGLVIAGVGCLHGIKTSFGAQAVGNSTTQAVVSSLIMLVVVDGVFALIYYILGI